MMELAVSFGQGLQMTNILKDIWDDRQAEKCWLPRSAFKNSEFELERFDEFHDSEVFRCGLHDLVAVAHGHLLHVRDVWFVIELAEHLVHALPGPALLLDR